MKSPDDKHKLIIDEEAAQVVRLIYAKRIEGYSCKNIAGYLNTMGFLSPSDYKVSKGTTISAALNRIQSVNGEISRSGGF